MWEQKTFALLTAVSEEIDRIYEKSGDDDSEENSEIDMNLDTLEEKEFILKTVFEISIRFRTGIVINSYTVRKGFFLVEILNQNEKLN